VNAEALRVLFVGAEFIWPPVTGGGIRTLSQLRVLASLPDVERVRFFSLRESAVGLEDRQALAREVAKVDVLEPLFHPIHLFAHPRYVPRVAWLRAVRRVPYLAGKWESPAVRAALERELRAHPCDVVWFGCLGMAWYLPLVRRLQPSARVVLDQHDVESDKFAQYARRQWGPGKLAAEAEWREARRFELQTLREVDAVGAICEDDARTYRRLAGVGALAVPQVVRFVRRSKRITVGPRLCYVGNLRWGPNVRGLDWFCQEVWPRVRARLPDAALEIAGTRLATDETGAPIVPRQWQAPGITTLGFIPDLGPLYERSAAMVAPSFDGTGVRLKLLEAFRNGVPVVTTPDGAAGLAVQSGREAFVEADPAEFGDRVVRLATSAAEQARLREAAYAFLERHHSLAAAEAPARALLGLTPPERTAFGVAEALRASA